MVCPIFGWFLSDFAGFWVIWLVYDQFVGGVASLWVVSSFTANTQQNPKHKRKQAKTTYVTR